MKFDFIINGKKQYIENLVSVVIYGDGEKLAEIEANHCETVEAEKEGTLFSDTRYKWEISGVELSQEIKNARKENLEREDNYLLSVKSRYAWMGKEKILYIHKSEFVNIEKKEILSFKTKEEKYYRTAFCIEFKNVTIKKYNWERIYTNGGWKIPDGGRWSGCFGTEERPCYTTFNNSENPLAIKKGIAGKGVIKKWITTETKENFTATIATGCYTRIERSENRQHAMQLAEEIKNITGNKTINYFEIEKILKVFNITKKAEA